MDFFHLVPFCSQRHPKSPGKISLSFLSPIQGHRTAEGFQEWEGLNFWRSANDMLSWKIWGFFERVLRNLEHTFDGFGLRLRLHARCITPCYYTLLFLLFAKKSCPLPLCFRGPCHWHAIEKIHNLRRSVITNPKKKFRIRNNI